MLHHHSFVRYVLLISLHSFFSRFFVSAFDSTDHWIEIIPTVPGFTKLFNCSQSCLLGVAKTIGCWSYGCVCSEHTPGPNFIHALGNVTACARASCQDSGSADMVLATSTNFQDICQVSGDYEVSASPTAIAPSQVSAIVVPSPTASFDPKTAAIVDTPLKAYTDLTNCLRWIFNVCKSPLDNSGNCSPDKPGDHTKIWQGIGVDMQCSTAECLCGDVNFNYTAQRLFDKARIFCGVEVPTAEDSSPDFKILAQMFTEYCSGKGGFVLAAMILSLKGDTQQRGLSSEAKIGIASGITSVFATFVFGTCGWKLFKKLR